MAKSPKGFARLLAHMEYSDQSDGAAIPLINPTTKRRLRVVANALSDDAGASFPLVRGVFRMTVLENYTANFGFQWNKFTRTQSDTASRTTQSRDRFFAETNWTLGGGTMIVLTAAGLLRWFDIGWLVRSRLRRARSPVSAPCHAPRHVQKVC